MACLTRMSVSQSKIQRAKVTYQRGFSLNKNLEKQYEDWTRF
jgi:hypothetical protein